MVAACFWFHTVGYRACPHLGDRISSQTQLEGNLDLQLRPDPIDGRERDILAVAQVRIGLGVALPVGDDLGVVVPDRQGCPDGLLGGAGRQRMAAARLHLSGKAAQGKGRPGGAGRCPRQNAAFAPIGQTRHIGNGHKQDSATKQSKLNGFVPTQRNLSPLKIMTTGMIAQLFTF